MYDFITNWQFNLNKKNIFFCLVKNLKNRDLIFHVQVKYFYAKVNWQIPLFFPREAIEALAAKREEDLQEIREELEQEMSNTRARLEEEVECKKKVGDHLMAG